MKTSGSKPKQLNGEDWRKIARGFAVAIVGSVVAWLAVVLLALQSDAPIDWVALGKSFLQFVSVAATSAAVNSGRKWLTDQRPTTREINDLHKVAKA